MGRSDHGQTSAADVCRVLDSLDADGVGTWISGGWGVDALLGRQTRPHRDLDLLIPFRQTLRAFDCLTSSGFRLETDWFPTRFEVVDRRGVIVDVHPIRLDADGTARLELPDGGWWPFDADSLDGHGVVGDRTVRCVSVAQQVRDHTGYEPAASDRHDIAALKERFGIDVPAPYE